MCYLQLQPDGVTFGKVVSHALFTSTDRAVFALTVSSLVNAEGHALPPKHSLPEKNKITN